MKYLIQLLVTLFVASIALAQSGADESKALASFKKAFHPKKSEPLAMRISALEAVASFDSIKVAQALVKVHRDLEGQLTEQRDARNELIAEMARLQKGQEYSARPAYTNDVHARFKEIKAGLAETRTSIDELRGLLADVRKEISELEDTEAVQWMIKSVLGSKKHSLLLKVAVSRKAGSLGAEVIKDLTRAFSKARRPEELVALLEGISFAGEDAKPLAPQLIKLLEHKDVAVRERAAKALSKVAVPEAIEPMIDLLEREEGRPAEAVAGALAVLTRQKHGTLVSAWRRWYADHKDEIFAAKAPLGGGMFDLGTKKVSAGYYFDIAMDGKSIMYIIDASGSMKEDIELELKDSKGAPKKNSRLEACKEELIAALGRLHEDAEFNVIWYSDLPRMFSPKMLPATKQNVEDGREWVRQLVPNGMTNIFDSLQMAFKLAGQGAKDKYYSVTLDTIFLLTDGSPTKPNGDADSTEKIIEAVREWNVLERIRIHTIGVGRNLNTAFLEQLARENGGEFRQY